MSFLSKILGFIASIFQKQPGATGLILDHPEDLAALPHHELFAGGDTPRDWRPFCPPFRYQGSSYWCTAFAGTSIASIFERLERGGYVPFSPLELFYRSGGFLFGNYLLATVSSMKQALVLEKDMPTPLLDSWNQTIFEYWRDRAKAGEAALNFGKQFAVKSAASVRTDKASLKQALASSPLMIAIGIGSGYFKDVAPKQSSYSAYHAVVLTHVDELGNYHIFDSLTQRSDFNGHHVLASDYEILSALSFIDLPDDWQNVQEQETHAAYPGALDHYGHRRILDLEQQAAKQLLEGVKKNPSVSGLMGRDWIVCVNAVAYGGYSVQDLLNHYTSIRRGKGPIFNLNTLRK